jgi:hypothetical protein
MRAHAALALILFLGGCGLIVEHPPVSCESLGAEECDRAERIARPLLDPYWEQANEVRVHPGSCSQSRGCSARRNTDPRFITVELVSESPNAAFVVIERHDGDWTARCSVTVATANGAHGEPCAD